MKITATEAINGIIETVLETIPDISKKKAKELVIESLIYNCVVEEIVGQVEFLYNNEIGNISDYDELANKPFIMIEED